MAAYDLASTIHQSLDAGDPAAAAGEPAAAPKRRRTMLNFNDKAATLRADFAAAMPKKKAKTDPVLDMTDITEVGSRAYTRPLLSST